ncbi:hypothetical protein BGZ99_007761 [Dissophora globulifera]|uniref:Uncharacterized protein n=1 Tax=Dissophora globulifera TaxID=979702 RepID=A0A9P6R8V9_9FUNG|nr:hypothetical protein BGZ99_007761 [Dissophora globulifera]
MLSAKIQELEKMIEEESKLIEVVMSQLERLRAAFPKSLFEAVCKVPKEAFTQNDNEVLKIMEALVPHDLDINPHGQWSELEKVMSELRKSNIATSPNVNTRYVTVEELSSARAGAFPYTTQLEGAKSSSLLILESASQAPWNSLDNNHVDVTEGFNSEGLAAGGDKVLQAREAQTRLASHRAHELVQMHPPYGAGRGKA